MTRRSTQENRMKNPAANPATSTIIPAGHAASTAEGEVGEHRANASTGLAGLSVAALGVIFGDIGTSPVYTFRECFNPEHRLPLDAAHVLGVLSLIFWALIIVVAVKYVLLIMRADNQGEGGILALLALALEAARGYAESKSCAGRSARCDRRARWPQAIWRDCRHLPSLGCGRRRAHE